MKPYLELAESNRQKAEGILRRAGIVEAWESIGAEVHLVGSLRMGLLAAHRDIDLHVYTDELQPEASFRAMAQAAARGGVKRMEWNDLSDTVEACYEWHLRYEDPWGEEWTLDVIQIRRGSRYDGYFERVADRISAVLTPETREAILRLKYETPDGTRIPGIAYYQAVLRDGVRTVEEFLRWRRDHPLEGVVEWIPGE